jgi:fermentation-respiration switch protein FrsA (DUF1100 family)
MRRAIGAERRSVAAAPLRRSLLAFAMAAVVGCSQSATPRPEGSRTPASSVSASPTLTSTPTPGTVPLREDSRAVSFRASDGTRLAGRLFPGGPTAIVLSHMGNPGNDQGDWFTTAGMLADRRYTVLTYNRRGVCPGGLEGCSRGIDVYGEHWRDVVGAVRYLHARGHATVVLIGASIGAMASFRAAERPALDIDGVVWIAGLDAGPGYLFDRPDVRTVKVPKLFISTEDDLSGGADSARRMFRWSVAPKLLVIVPGREHGTDMITSGTAWPDVFRTIVRFLQTYARG